jgi:hypothetical protein
MTMFRNENGKQIALSAEEEASVLQQQEADTAEVNATRLRAAANKALEASDITVLRCVEAGVSVPEEWAAYRAALRAITASGAGALPTKPPYPAGT